MVAAPSVVQVLLTSLVSVRMPKLDLENSEWVVTTPSDLQILMSLVGVQVTKLDPEKSQWVVMILSGLQISCVTYRCMSA